MSFEQLSELVEYPYYGLSLKYSISHVNTRKDFRGKRYQLKSNPKNGRGSVTPLRRTEDE